MGVGFSRTLSATIASTAPEEPVAPPKSSWWRDAVDVLLGAPTPADRAMRADRAARRDALEPVVKARDRVEAALVGAGYASRAEDAALDVAGPLADYARRLGLVEPRLRVHIGLDDRFSLSLQASRYARNVPTLREGCPELVSLVEQTLGAKVRERFEAT